MKSSLNLLHNSSVTIYNHGFHNQICVSRSTSRALLFHSHPSLGPQTNRQHPIYLHEILNGTDPTAVPVTARSNYAGTNPLGAVFGAISIMDNPLRTSRDPNSILLGRAQGLYAMASQSEVVLFMSATYWFTAGSFNGSSFSLVGLNHAMKPLREIPIVGCTGRFRLAKGYCMVRTIAMDGSNNIIGYNGTLFHY
ncbi:dirigent protein 1-like [Tripterygium wilfordii]|uniref:dirigent protein 1-like n=1 Tax=Tripterygium wilfordii TaxID=458696 RepID=UPI0018F7E742|nr:dirigent protein 1-like [Tripterygium wilfordii]XP_038725585.1 dirigent protein 1-like [Tripterygium wilfordii]